MGDVNRMPTRARLVSPHSVLSDPHHRMAGPAARTIASHRIVDQASRDLHAGDAGSGVKALVFASATHLALTIGADAAGDFFEMIARIAREVRPPEPAA